MCEHNQDDLEDTDAVLLAQAECSDLVRQYPMSSGTVEIVMHPWTSVCEHNEGGQEDRDPVIECSLSSDTVDPVIDQGSSMSHNGLDDLEDTDPGTLA